MKLEHGFTTREEWAEFFNQYYASIRLINQKANELLRTRDGVESWIEKYKECSALQRSIYVSGNQQVQRHIEYFLEDNTRLQDAIADSLLSYQFRYCTRMEDTDLTYRSACMLSTYYANRHDEISLMKCSFIKLVCFAYLDTVHFRARSLELVTQMGECYERLYGQLSQEDQSLGLSIYDYMSTLLFEHIDSVENYNTYFNQTLLPSYQKGLQSYKRFIEKADWTLEVNEIVPYLKINYMNSFIMSVLNLQKGMLSASNLRILQDMSHLALLAAQQQKDGSSFDLMKWQLTCAMCDYLRQNRDAKAMVELVDTIDSRIPYQCNYSRKELDDIQFNLLLSLCNVIYALSKEVDMSMHVERILEKVIGYIAFLPSDLFTEYRISHAVYYEVIPLLSLVREAEDVIRYFMDLFMLRQPQTLIHTYMVAACSKAILRQLLKEKPELLIGLLGLGSVEAIQQKGDDMLAYIHNAALVHDVGKVLCTSVINTQYRSISELEFEAIQYHPLTGRHILSRIGKLAAYSEVAANHHRSVNGVFGYPQGVEPPSEAYHLFTCMITISDSLDAATDSYGRNYASSKTFARVLEEMKNDENRYHAELVRFIEECIPLREELSYIIRCKRAEVYEHVYHLLKEKQSKNEGIWQRQTQQAKHDKETLKGC